MADTKRICLWSGPRNISTALMYAFAQRRDTTVVDEHLYAHYLTSTDAREYHPGAEEVITHQKNSAEAVIDQVILGTYETAVVFFKQMTHHLVDLDQGFLKDTINVILTREPKDMLRSYARQIKHPAMRDVGYAKQIALLDHLKGIGQRPMVIDSKQVLLDPEGKLTALCAYAGLPFDEAMLSWEAGPRAEDGVWAEHWYDSVHQSTGFKSYEPNNDPFPDHLKDLLEECEAIYKKLTGE